MRRVRLDRRRERGGKRSCWEASVEVEGRDYHLGFHETEEEAEAACDEGERMFVKMFLEKHPELTGKR